MKNILKKILILGIFGIGLFLFFSPSAFATTYKPAQSGNWSAGATWDSGVAPDATVDVVLDNAYNVTVNTTTCVAKTVTQSSTGTLTITDAMKLTVSGSVTLASGKFTAGGDTAELAMIATGTLTSATNTLGIVRFNGASQTFTLGDDLTTRALSFIFIRSGTFDTDEYDINSGGVLSIGTTTRAIDITNSTLNLSSTATDTTGAAWYMQSTVGMTLTTTGSTINLTGAVNNWFYGAGTYNIVTSVSQAILYIYASPTIYSLTRTNTTGQAATINLQASFSIADNGTLTIQGGADNRYRILVQSTTIGSTRTITLGTGVTTNFERVDFKDITFSSALDLSAITGGSGDLGGNTNITFSTPRTLYWYSPNASAGQIFYYSHYTGTGNNPWWTGSGGTGTQLADQDSPRVQDDIIFDSSSIRAGTTTIRFDQYSLGRDIISTNVTNTPTWYDWGIGSYYVLGSMAFGTWNVTDATVIYQFLGRGTHTFNQGGRATMSTVYFAHVGGSMTLLSDLTLKTAGTFQWAKGIFDADIYNVTASRFQTLAGTAGATNNLYMGSGTWKTVITSASTSVFNYTTGNVYAETSTLEISGNSTTGARVLTFGGITLNNLTISGEASSTGTIAIIGNVTINGTLTIAAPNRIRVFKGYTITMGSASTISAVGSSGNLIEFDTVDGTETWTITRPSGTQTFGLDWLTLNRSVAMQTNTFYAGANTSDTGTNTNWIFTAPPLTFRAIVIIM